MREERKVVDRDETPRLEELSDQDLEVVAGGFPKPNGNGFFHACVVGPGNAPFCQ